MLKTYLYKKTSAIPITTTLALINGKLNVYPKLNIALFNHYKWLKTINNYFIINKNYNTNLENLSSSILVNRIRKLHKKAGTSRKKFTRTVTMHWFLSPTALQIYLNYTIQRILYLRLTGRLYIYLKMYLLQNWRYQPIWIEKHLISSSRTKKLLKR